MDNSTGEEHSQASEQTENTGKALQSRPFSFLRRSSLSRRKLKKMQETRSNVSSPPPPPNPPPPPPPSPGPPSPSMKLRSRTKRGGWGMTLGRKNKKQNMRKVPSDPSGSFLLNKNGRKGSKGNLRSLGNGNNSRSLRNLKMASFMSHTLGRNKNLKERSQSIDMDMIGDVDDTDRPQSMLAYNFFEDSESTFRENYFRSSSRSKKSNPFPDEKSFRVNSVNPRFGKKSKKRSTLHKKFMEAGWHDEGVGKLACATFEFSSDSPPNLNDTSFDKVSIVSTVLEDNLDDDSLDGEENDKFGDVPEEEITVKQQKIFSSEHSGAFQDRSLKRGTSSKKCNRVSGSYDDDL